MKVEIISRKPCSKFMAKIASFGYDTIHLSTKNLGDFHCKHRYLRLGLRCFALCRNLNFEKSILVK